MFTTPQQRDRVRARASRAKRKGIGWILSPLHPKAAQIRPAESLTTVEAHDLHATVHLGPEAACSGQQQRKTDIAKRLAATAEDPLVLMIGKHTLPLTALATDVPCP